MKKKSFFSIAIAICMMALTGCADAMPDLTEEQQDMIAEYSAQQLLKYCSYYDSGIDKTALLEEPETESFVEEETTEEPTTEEILENADAEENSETVADAVGIQNIEQDELAGLLEQDEFEITYDKYELDASYPEDENAFFSLDAPEGKKLLVLFFNIQNMSSDEAMFDLLNTDVSFKVNFNDTGYKSNLPTLLMDDLATYEGKFAGNETKQAVLILQVDEEDVSEVESLTLQIQIADNTSQIKLL